MTRETFDAHLEQGNRHQGELDYVSAATCFGKALKAAKRDPIRQQASRLKLAAAQLVLGRWSEAEKELRKVLQRAGDGDREGRFEARMILGELLEQRGEPAEAGELLEGALDDARNLHDKTRVARARALLAEHLGRVGSVQESKDHLDEGLAAVEGLEDDVTTRSLKATLLTQLGLYYFRLARMKEAEGYATEALELVAGDAPSLVLANVKRYLGVIAGLRRKHRTSLLHHLDALDLFRRAACPFGQAKVYESIGRTFLALNRMEEAVFSFKRCEDLCIELGARPELATLYGKLGQVYMLREDYATAAFYFRKDLELSISFRNPYALGYSYRNLGQCLVQLEQLPQAVENLRESLNLFTLVEDSFNVARVETDLCQAYIRLEQPSEATVLCRQAREIFKAHEMHKELAFLLSLSGSIARLEGDFENADRRLSGAIAQLSEHGNSAWLAEAFYQKGLLERDRGNRELAVDNLKSAVRVARQAGLSRETGRYLHDLKELDERELYLTWMEGLRDAIVPRGAFEDRLAGVEHPD